MTVWSKSEKFLMGMFHDSLSGDAFEWFMELEPERKRDWKEFTHTFVNQYAFNIGVPPSREKLLTMKKKSDESFKEYAQRWMTQAVRVRPPLSNADMCNLFITTLDKPFISHMVGGSYKSFTEVISAGERIETVEESGKLTVAPTANIQSGDQKKSYVQKKTNPEVHQVQYQPTFLPRQPAPYPTYHTPSPQYSYQPPQTFYPPQYPHNYPQSSFPQIHNTATQPFPQPYRGYPPPQQTNPPRPIYGNPPNQPFPGYRPQRPPRDTRPFPNIGMSKAQLLEVLLQQNVLALRPMMRDLQPPYPAWYDPNATCEFHMGTKGHSLEKCDAFRLAVLRLIDQKVVSLEAQNPPNVQNNPLPNHGGQNAVGLIEREEEQVLSKRDLGLSMGLIFDGLRQAGYMIEGSVSDSTKGCKYHGETADHDIETCAEFAAKVQRLRALGVIQLVKQVKPEVNMLTLPSGPPPKEDAPLIRIFVPQPFNYTDTHAVPWQYETSIMVNGEVAKIPPIQDLQAASVSNVRKVITTSNIGGITRTGKCYTSEELEKLRKAKLKEVEKVPEVTAEGKAEEEVDEFLKIIKQSDYNIVEQLHKTPSRISLFSLIMSSDVHRKALQDMLSKAFVRPDITTDNMVNMVDPVKHVNLITFSDDEIPPATNVHPWALHITLKCYKHIVAKVLIDGGSALNVLPLCTLHQLPVYVSEIQDTSITVRAFDGTASKTMGKVMLQLQIGPTTFNTDFEVMDIDASYTMLLGRPWIHNAKAVPSTLHQRVKFISGQSVITVQGENDLLVMKPSSVPYIETPEQKADSSHHSFEIIEETVNESTVARSVAEGILKKHGFQDGKGLGVNSQGITEPISLPENHDKAGLGYQGDLSKEMQTKLMLNGGQVKLRIPPLKGTFVGPAEVIAIQEDREVDVADDGPKEDRVLFPVIDEDLSNWVSSPLPDVLSIM